MLSICYSPSSQDDDTNEILLQLFREILGQQNLVFMGDNNYLDINTTVVHSLSIRFPKCFEDCFLLQMLDMSTRKST